MSFVNALVIQNMPLGNVTLTVFILLSIVFYATSIDSAAYVLASVCAKNLPNDAEPTRWNRLAWAILLAIITAGVLQSGTLDTIKSITALTSIPLIPIMVILCLSLLRWLNDDFSDVGGQRKMMLPSGADRRQE
jgi:BCCT family betaine/carnitine transporter